MDAVWTSRLAIVIAIAGQSTDVQAQGAPADPVKVLVERLDLERYKATIKGLTLFGDRREGTARNRAAVDWIETQLKSYGCTDTERIKYVYDTILPPPRQGAAASRRWAIASGEIRRGVGGSRLRGMTRRVVPNDDPKAQTDPALRARNAELPASGPREEVFCTKVGGTHGYFPELREMESSFFIAGPGIAAGRALGRIDMRDIAPTLANLLGVKLPTAEGRDVFSQPSR